MYICDPSHNTHLLLIITWLYQVQRECLLADQFPFDLLVVCQFKLNFIFKAMVLNSTWSDVRTVCIQRSASSKSSNLGACNTCTRYACSYKTLNIDLTVKFSFFRFMEFQKYTQIQEDQFLGEEISHINSFERTLVNKDEENKEK